MKAKAGIFLATVFVIFGIVGIILDAIGALPPELNVPVLQTVVTILAIVVAGLGFQDELESGKKTIVDLIKNFFTSSPYRMLGLTVLLTVAKTIVDSSNFPRGFELAGQIFIAIATALGLGAAAVQYRIAKLEVKLHGRRS